MELHHKRYGEQGDPVIILHGLFGSSDNWSTVSHRLSDWYRVYALDLRNHGRSPHLPEMTFDLMADDVIEFMTQHQLAQPNLMGHSLGGKVAMQLALNAPEKVRKLIVVDIAPRLYLPEHAGILEALLELDLSKFANRRQVEDALAQRIPDISVRRFLVKGIRQESHGPMMWRMNLASIARNYSGLIQGLAGNRQFSGQALFLKGADSDYIGPQDESVIRKSFPAAVIKSIAGAGHWLHAELPELFCREVLEFLH